MEDGRLDPSLFLMLELNTAEHDSMCLSPHPTAPAYSPPTLEPHSSKADDPSSTAPEPRPSSPWDDPTYANRKETRYLAPDLGTIQIQAYRAKNLKKEAAPGKKDTKADATTKRSAAEYKTRSSASHIAPPPLELHEDDGRQASKSNTHHHLRSPHATLANPRSWPNSTGYTWIPSIGPGLVSFSTTATSESWKRGMCGCLEVCVCRGMSECW